MLALRGHSTWGVDIAPTAIERARHLTHDVRGAHFVVGDVRSMRLPGAFDAVVEHTCLCALPIDDRPRYIQSLAGQLSSGGRLVGAYLCFANPEPASPPFGISPQQLLELLIRYFEIEHIAEAAEPFPPYAVGVSEHVARVPQLELVARRRA